jgi:hypothetical protein
LPKTVAELALRATGTNRFSPASAIYAFAEGRGTARQGRRSAAAATSKPPAVCTQRNLTPIGIADGSHPWTRPAWVLEFRLVNAAKAL